MADFLHSSMSSLKQSSIQKLQGGHSNIKVPAHLFIF